MRFSSTEVDPGVFDVVVDLNGMVLSALVDRDHQVAEVDGFAASGTDTQIVVADRELLRRLGTALERGLCFGNCGPGCPGGVQTLTLDCHDHDQCVRNGHALASVYCDDEFVSASDDEPFAPRCSGT